MYEHGAVLFLTISYPCACDVRYPYHGGSPLTGFADSNGQMLFPVPGNGIHAKKALEDLKSGKQPTVVTVAFHDGRKGSQEAVAHASCLDSTKSVLPAASRVTALRSAS